MGMVRRRSSLTHSRPVRALTALILTLAVASTGIVALAGSAVAVAPATTILTSPSPATDKNPTPTWTFDVVAGPTWECSVDKVPAVPTTWLPCDSGTYAAPALTTDGDYVFSVRQVVVADTADVASSAPYTFDSTAQATVTPTRTPYNDPRPSWNIALEPGGAATCSLDLAAAVPCTGGFTAQADVAEGTHTLDVSFTDALGNTGATSSTTVVDLTKPLTPAPAGAPVLSSNPVVSWSWTAGPGETATCTLVGPVTTVGPSSCPSATSFGTTVVAEGDYTLHVFLTDPATNVGATGISAVYTFDKTPPPPPVLQTDPGARGTNTSPTWTFTTPGTTTTCVLSSTTHGVRNLGSCQSPGPGQPGTARGVTLPDDSWTLTITTRDDALNPSSATSSYLLDTTGPAAPDVDPPAPLGNDAAPRFTWIGELPSTAVCREVKTDTVGTTYGAWGDCTGRYFDLALTQDADYQVQAQLTDTLGNVGQIGISEVYTYDGTPPVQPVLAGAPLIGSNPAPTYTFSVETGGSATCRFTQGALSSAVTSCSSGSYQPTLPGEGNFVIEVTTKDKAGNPSVPGTRTYSLDRTAPGPATITSPPSPGKNAAPSWGIVGDGSSVLTCRLLGTVPATVVTSCTNGYLGNLTGQVDGSYTLEVTATDAAGNTTVVTATYVYDTAAPSAPTVSGPVSPGNAFSPSWTFAVQAQTTARCRLVQGLTLGSWSDCSGGTFTVNGLADGTYTVDVLVTDLAGNDAPLASSAAYTSDRTAPAAPTVSGPSGPGKNASPTWTWTGESGARATCRLDRAGVIGSAVPCNSGTFSPTLTGDSTYVVVVQLTDAAGNPSVVTTSAVYALDTVVPAQPTVSGPSGIGNDANPVWTFTAEAGAVTECRLVRAGVSGAWSTCTSGQARALPNDAVYAFHVRVTDAAGNVSPVGVSAPYTYDGTAPATPVVTAPVSPSSSLTPAWLFVAEPGATAQCRLMRAGALVRDWAACTTPATFDLTGLPDASYVVEVRVTDPAGNTSATGTALAYLLDTTPPDPPTVSGPAGPSTNAAPTFTWTGEAGAGALCRLVHDGVIQGPSAFACTTPYTAALDADGQWSLRVRLVDAAGNRSLTVGQSGTYVLDTVAPVAPTVTPPASPGRDTAPSWSAVVEPGATTECRLTGAAAVLFDWSTCRLPLTTDLSTRPDGTYVLAVRATDAAGQTGPAGSASYGLDTTAPAAPVFTSVPASPFRGRSVTFAFSSEAGSTLTCRLTNGATVVSPDTACTSPLPVSLTGLPDGAYTLSVHAKDAAGNSGPAQTATYVLDTAAPAAPVLVTGPAATGPDHLPSWTFTAEAGATVVCRITGAATGVAVPDTVCTSPFVGVLTTAADDTYTLTARATDVAGNTGPALSSTYLLDSSAPSTATVVGPASPGRITAPTWQVSSSEGTVQCRLVKGGTLVRDWTTCGPTFAVNLATFGDGVYVLSARVVDAAGNLSAEVTSRYVLDTTPPAPATLTSPPSPANDRAPTWTIASPDAGVTAQCQVLGPSGAVARAFAPCAVSVAGSQYNLDLSTAMDGAWTLVVRLTDTAGNTGTDARASYVLDTSAPNSVLVISPASPSSAATPTWLLTGDSDAVLECRLTGPGLTASTFAPCTPTPGVPGAGSFTADLTSRSDGTYILAVRSRDASGNLGPETTSGYEVDRVAPAAPTVPVAPPSPSQVAAITWDFTLEAGSTALCTLSSATAVVAPEQPCASPWATDLGAFGDGDYGLSVRAVDAAGNLSPSVVGRYVLDRTAPAAPAIVTSPGSPAPDLTPTWRLQPSDPTDSLECQLVGLPTPVWGPCGDPATFDLAPATAGTFQLLVREIDAARNVSPVTRSADYILDLTAPVTPEVTPPTPQRHKSTMPVFTITRQPEDVDTDHLLCTVTRFDGGTSTASPCAFGPSTVDLTQTPALEGEGDVVLGVRAVDALGNVSGETKATYTFDNIPPSTPTTLPLAEVAAFLPSVQWTFASDVSTDTFRCELRRKGVTDPVSSGVCSSPHTVTLPSTGEYTLSVWAVDNADNSSLLPVTSTYTYLPPVPAVGAPKGPTTGADDTPTWTFSVPRPSHTATCSLSGPGGTSIETKDCTGGTYTGTLTDLPAGTYTLTIQLTDAFGNTGKVTKTTYKYTPKAAQDGHLGQPGAPTPPSRPGPVDNPQPPSVPGPPKVTPAGPTAGSAVDPTPPRGLNPVAPGKDSKPIATSAGPRTPVPPALEKVPGAIAKAITDLGRKPTIPLLLLLVVVGFLLLQNQIDRRDPKLASAPVGAEPELDFGPVLGLRPSVPKPMGGGAPA
jgi:hypothetical protein